MRIAGYARISSREQTQDSTALDQQINRLRAAGAQDIFVDIESGSKDNRPEFSKVMELVKAHQVDELVVTRLDRLTRSLITLRSTIKVFEQSKVILRALDDHIDCSTAAGRFQLNMLGSLAEMETDRLSERIKHGWSYRRQQVKANAPPFGYCQTVDKKYQLDHTPYCEGKTRAEVAREIIDTYLEFKSIYKTLRVMCDRYGSNRRERTTNADFPRTPIGIRGWLTNPVLQGHTAYGKSSSTLWEDHAEIIPNTHPDDKLLSPFEVTLIHSTMAINRQGRYRACNEYPLSGLVYCADCGRSMVVKKGGNKRHIIYYWCSFISMGRCSNRKRIRADFVESWLIQALCQVAERTAQQVLEPKEVIDNPEILALQRKLEGLDKLGSDPILEQAKLSIRLQIQRLKEKNNQDLTSFEISQDLLIGTLANPNYWDTVNTERKRELFRLFTNKISVSNGHITGIDLKF